MKVSRKYKRLAQGERVRKYIGPTRLWWTKGALQFLICISLGLERHHDFLDVGCGALRAGRWFIPYLDRGKYHGIEAVKDVVDYGLEQEVGKLSDKKEPKFWHNDKFEIEQGKKFNMMLCHAVMFHIAKSDIERLFNMVKAHLKPDGLFIGNYHIAESDFGEETAIYPEITRYQRQTMQEILRKRGLSYAELELKDYNQHCRWFTAGRELDETERALIKNITRLWMVLRNQI